MLTPIQCLNEIVSVVPNSERRFHVENELMGLDPEKAIAAQSFKGKLLVSEDGQDYETETECRFIEVFYEGGVHITTVLTEELKELLFRLPKEGVSKEDSRKMSKPKNLQPYNEPKKLPEYNRTDVNSWN